MGDPFFFFCQKTKLLFGHTKKTIRMQHYHPTQLLLPACCKAPSLLVKQSILAQAIGLF